MVCMSREYWMFIEDQAFSPSYDFGLLTSSPPFLSSVSSLSFSVFLSPRSMLLTGEGWGRSQIIRQRKSLALYMNHWTVCSVRTHYTSCRVYVRTVIELNVRIYSINGGGAAGLHWNNDFNEWVIKDLIILQKLRNYNLEVPLWKSGKKRSVARRKE